MASDCRYLESTYGIRIRCTTLVKTGEMLGFRHTGVVHDEYAVPLDGMKAFGALDLATEMEGCRCFF